MICGMNESNESPGSVLNCHRASKGTQTSYNMYLTEKHPPKQTSYNMHLTEKHPPKQTSYNMHLTEKHPPKQTNIYRYTAKRTRAEK